LPPAARAEIAKREQDIAQLTGRFAEERALSRQFQEISQRHQDVIQSQGMPPANIFENMLGVIKILNSPDTGAKAALLRDVMRLNGITPQHLGIQNSGPQPANGAPGGAAINPSALPPPVARVVNEWSQFQAERQRAKEAEQIREQEKVNAEIASFRTKPEAEFFDAVQDQMIGLLTGELAQTLEEAYNSAIAIRPDIQAILNERKAQAAAQAAAKRNRVIQARQRGGSVRGGSGTSVPADTGNRSIREELKAGFAEARARI
jgi:phage antirepressor YoqD-like protein